MRIYNIRTLKLLQILILISLIVLLCLYVSNQKSKSLQEIESLCLNKRKSMEMFNDFESLNQFGYPLCNNRSRRHGYHQKVISVSAYQSNRDNKLLTDKILSYTFQYLNESKYFYPDWRVRVYYHNLPITEQQILQIENQFGNVDFCDSQNIPFVGDLTSFMSGRLHRYIAFADPFVDLFMSRDLDSPILQREVTSVSEWLSSNKYFHIIRDHPLHYDVMLAGLWAMKISENETIRHMLTERLLTKSLTKCWNSQDGDLRFLEKYVWPLAESNSMQHDSFHCQKYHLSVPFTQSKFSSSKFIGCRRPCRSDQDPPGPCPIQCLLRNSSNTNLC